MSFLNPFFLIGSLALAVPVLIHLVRREKSEVVRFSSLMFLLKVPKRSVRQQKLKNLLLMLLRLLILALLVAAFMRPYLSNSPFGGGDYRSESGCCDAARQFLQHALRHQLRQDEDGG